MTVESWGTIQLASGSPDPKEITLRGDPFFRSRLADLSMQISPDAKSPGTTPLPNGGKVLLPAWHRSVDISGKLELLLPFENLPAGRYNVILRGKVHTAWRSSDFAPQEPLRLEVRDPVSVKKVQVTPWPPGAAVGKFRDALVELRLDFGRPKEVLSNLQVRLPGKWVGWSIVDPLSGGIVEKLSSNTLKEPKSVVFALRDFPSKAFASQSLRLQIQATSALTPEQWRQAVPEPEVDFY